MAGVQVLANVNGQTVPVVSDGIIVHMSFEGKIDIAQEKGRLNTEVHKLEKLRDDASARLSNEDFVKKASEEVVIEHKERVEKLDARIQQLNYVIQSLDVIV